jgi:glutamine---fructose-6-phosphate transaminase (isomerizing)
VARGYEYATAREWAIKIKELAHVFADPYSAADFQHGPVALVEPGVPVIVVVRAGPAAAGLIELLGRLRDDFDADLTVLSDVPEALAIASRPVALPAVAAEWLAPIATVVAGQLHALHLTRARGLDPDAPRSISKVTRTR